MRGNPWQCDFNLKSQISMPGTQAARALRAPPSRAHIARTGFLGHEAMTPPPGLLHYQMGFISVCSLTCHPRGVIFLNQRTHHTNVSAALEDEMKNTPISRSGSAPFPVFTWGTGSKCSGTSLGPLSGWEGFLAAGRCNSGSPRYCPSLRKLGWGPEGTH